MKNMNDSGEAIRIIRVWLENAITNEKNPATLSFLLKGKKLDKNSIYQIKPTNEINESNWRQISEIEDLQEAAKGELFSVEQRLTFEGSIEVDPKTETGTEDYLYDLKIKTLFSLNPFLNHCFSFIAEMEAARI
jgi:hypothetical protein